jgi:hypothetical protein
LLAARLAALLDDGCGVTTPGSTLADPPVATAEGLLTDVVCWLIMATAIALERACTFPVTLTTRELELPVAMVQQRSRAFHVTFTCVS